ncbi:DUF3168 domain-containing protein [Streptomyces bohaiensis]|uniref:DUF3168 domain-containing protein n=1 Tax=Streptomyces bohaiensis TaxID=1431344 RepID=UPI003B7B40B8
MTAFLPVQQAVYDLLTSDTALMGLVTGGVHDGPPENAMYPWIDIGEAIETPSGTHDTRGRETVITLHTWTRHRGHAPGLAIARRIDDLLDHRPLVVAGHHHISTTYEFAQTLRDPTPPGDIRHHVARYRVTTEQGG